MNTGEWTAWIISCLVLGCGNVAFAMLGAGNYAEHRLKQWPTLAAYWTGYAATGLMLIWLAYVGIGGGR